MSLCRDRLAYTQHCFGRLRMFAGCSYDHYVLDQGSEDGSVAWLEDEWRADRIRTLVVSGENRGIPAGMNTLIDTALGQHDYDVIVKFDNDCEMVQPDTLRTVCRLVDEGQAILSPKIRGLRNPPVSTRNVRIGDTVIEDIPQIGGIFLAVPGWWFSEGWRYSEDSPVWGGDDIEICRVWRARGGTCGYVADLEAWHYEGTDGQHATFPEYFERRVLEGGPV